MQSVYQYLAMMYASKKEIAMTFDEYQKKALSTNLAGKNKSIGSHDFLINALGLVGESGEFLEKIKKILRDQKGELKDDNQRELLQKELGDVLWYVAVISDYLEIPLSKLADQNIAKLADRNKRKTLRGAGDTR